ELVVVRRVNQSARLSPLKTEVEKSRDARMHHTSPRLRPVEVQLVLDPEVRSEAFRRSTAHAVEHTVSPPPGLRHAALDFQIAPLLEQQIGLRLAIKTPVPVIGHDDNQGIVASGICCQVS